MEISILVDSKDSWFCDYAEKLSRELGIEGHKVSYVHDSKELQGGDICFLLSCVKLVKKDRLQLYKHNIVIHASDLPKGKGFTPLKWQIIEGKDDIPITLFEAVEEMDAGNYYFKETVHFEGHELLDEMQEIMGNKICSMAMRYVLESESLVSIKQEGTETIYSRRTVKDDELDISQSIESQFNHFRIADNERFPIWFRYRNHEYILKIEKKKG